MKQINYITIQPDSNTVTDGQIMAGIEYILRTNPEIKFNKLKALNVDSNQDWFHELPLKQDVNLILVCGTPFMWHDFQHSVKIKNTIDIIQHYTNVKVIFIGIGACIELDHMDSGGILESNNETRCLTHLYNNKNLVITRDVLAYKKLKRIQLNSALLPDPSLWAINLFTEAVPDQFKFVPNQKTQSTQVWYDPLIGISSVYWHRNPIQLQQYYQRYLNFKDPMKSVYCKTLAERDSAVRILNLEPQIWANPLAVHLTLSKTKRLQTGRVHIALPALSHDIPEIELIPIDSRYLTFESAKNLLKQKSKAEYLKQYHNLITSYLLLSQTNYGPQYGV